MLLVVHNRSETFIAGFWMNYRKRSVRMLAALRHFETAVGDQRCIESAPKGVGWSTIDDLVKAGLLESAGKPARGLSAPFRTTEAGRVVLASEEPDKGLHAYERQVYEMEGEWDPTIARRLAESPAKADRTTMPSKSRARADCLSYPPRGLSRIDAARYIGISTTKFDEMVADGRMPASKRIDARRVWDRYALDQSFDSLPEDRERRNSGSGGYL